MLHFKVAVATTNSRACYTITRQLLLAFFDKNFMDFFSAHGLCALRINKLCLHYIDGALLKYRHSSSYQGNNSWNICIHELTMIRYILKKYTSIIRYLWSEVGRNFKDLLYFLVKIFYTSCVELKMFVEQDKYCLYFFYLKELLELSNFCIWYNTYWFILMIALRPSDFQKPWLILLKYHQMEEKELKCWQMTGKKLGEEKKFRRVLDLLAIMA